MSFLTVMVVEYPYKIVDFQSFPFTPKIRRPLVLKKRKQHQAAMKAMDEEKG